MSSVAVLVDLTEMEGGITVLLILVDSHCWFKMQRNGVAQN